MALLEKVRFYIRLVVIFFCRDICMKSNTGSFLSPLIWMMIQNGDRRKEMGKSYICEIISSSFIFVFMYKKVKKLMRD